MLINITRNIIEYNIIHCLHDKITIYWPQNNVMTDMKVCVNGMRLIIAHLGDGCRIKFRYVVYN